jgi:hypothetical protein
MATQFTRFTPFIYSYTPLEAEVTQKGGRQDIQQPRERREPRGSIRTDVRRSEQFR